MRLLTFLLLSFLVFGEVFSQLPGGGGSGKSKRSDKDVSFVPIPYVSYDRSQGFQFGALPIVMYNLSKKDTISPSSISGALGMFTTEKTWFTMIFNKWYLKEDKYRILAAGGIGDFNFQFFSDNPISPGFINYSTGSAFAVAEIQRKVFDNFYVGGRYIFARLNTTFELENRDIETTSDLNGLGVVLSYDRRDNVYYPYKGFMVNLNYNSFPEFMNENKSNKVELDFEWYHSLRNKKDVFAVRTFVGVAVGELDFNQQFIVGGIDVRGYSQGEFRGDQLIALQGEYRWNVTEKLGFVGFGGVATVFNAINDDDSGKLLPGAGAGFRVNVFPKNHMNVGIDGAIGVDDWAISFQIGEAF